jgi:transcriptional regulator with XRE-family HTH domain
MCIFSTREATWNERLKTLINQYLKDNNINRQILAERFNKKYGTKFYQSRISEWTSVGNERTINGKKTTLPFPSLETCLYICDFFNVDLGYLLGETDEMTFELSDASRYLNLSAKSITTIKLATSEETAFQNTGLMADDSAQIIDRIISSDKINLLFRRFLDLDSAYSSSINISSQLNQLEKKHGKETLTKAFDYLSIPKDNQFKQDLSTLDSSLVYAIKDLEVLLDNKALKESDKRFALLALKYQLISAFSDLVEDLYPSDPIS